MAKKASDEQIREGYARLGNIWLLAKELNMCGQSVHERCVKLGIIETDFWTKEEEFYLLGCYAAVGDDDDIDLDGVTRSLNDIFGTKRLKTNVCRKAKKLGLTNQRRKSSEKSRALTSEGVKRHFEKHGHPRGMLGKKHSKETCKAMSDRMIERSRNTSKKKKSEIARKSVNTRIEKYGSGNAALKSPNAYSRCRRGKREDIGEFFFRSSWEANYARYLNMLVRSGDIKGWDYEPETFVFHGVTRGPISYTPDFKVFLEDGSHVWHEVKGWMDSKSKSKLKRFSKYYPNETVKVVGSKEYNEIKKLHSINIAGWE